MKNLFLSILAVSLVGILMVSGAFAQNQTSDESVEEDPNAGTYGLLFIIGIVIIIVILIKKVVQKNKELKQANSRIKKQKKHLSKMEQSNYVKPTDTKKDSLFCVSCGAKLNPKAKFCKECGSNQATQS